MSIGNHTSVRSCSVHAQSGDAITFTPYRHTSRPCVPARLRRRVLSNLPRAAKCVLAPFHVLSSAGRRRVGPTRVLTRYGQEGDSSPFLFDPRHLNTITFHSGDPVVRRPLELQVLPTGESCLIRRDRATINNRSHQLPWIPPSHVAILF